MTSTRSSARSIAGESAVRSATGASAAGSLASGSARSRPSLHAKAAGPRSATGPTGAAGGASVGENPANPGAGIPGASSRWTTPRRTPVVIGSEPASGQSTRDRLLDAAEHLFAEHGFADTSVRDLTREANCNLASVNYHFGGKENLYIEVFERMLKHIMALRTSAISQVLQSKNPTIEDVFRAFAVAFFEPLRQQPQRGERLMKLYSREMAQPMLPAGMFFVELVKPTIDVMNRAYDLTFPGLTDNQKLWCLYALVGPLVNVLQANRFFEQAHDHGLPPAAVSDMTPDEAVDHVVLIATASAHAMLERNRK